MQDSGRENDADPGRRQFMAGLGKFSVLTPPAVTTLLHVSMNSPAVAASGGNQDTGAGGGQDTGAKFGG